SELRQFPFLEVVACADLDPGRAKAQADKFDVPRACSAEELLSDGSIDIAVNLTVPLAHVSVSMAAIAAGLSVYSEKPLAIAPDEAFALLDAADAAGVLVGCAPDTFLGRGLQTARALVDE